MHSYEAWHLDLLLRSRIEDGVTLAKYPLVRAQVGELAVLPALQLEGQAEEILAQVGAVNLHLLLHCICLGIQCDVANKIR